MTEPNHPDDATLAKLAEGKLAGDELTQLEHHLDTCGSCRTLLAVVSNGSAPSAAIERATLSPGEKLGRFEIERLIGAGAMGMLYVAKDPQLGRRVALKLMRPAFNDEVGRIRLLREAQAMAQLSHPNVVHVYELGELANRVFIAMELLEGGTLRDWMKVPRTWREKLQMFVAAGEGLYAAHKAGVVHRDFKPENVMIGKDGRPRVGDFGLARPELIAEEEPPINSMRITQAGAILGTPAYMSPEQLAGKPADMISDQYGFCVALYEALVGRRPFPTDSVAELRTLVLGGMPPPPTEGPVPAHVWAAIARGLHPDPAKRFQDLGELLEVLQLHEGATRLPASIPGPRRDPRKTARYVAAAALATAVLSLIITKASWSPLAHHEPQQASSIEAPAAAVSEELIEPPTYLQLAPGAVESFVVEAGGSVDLHGDAPMKFSREGAKLTVTAISAGQAVLTYPDKGGQRKTTISVFQRGAPWAHPLPMQLVQGETSLAHFPELESVESQDPRVAVVEKVHGDGALVTAREPGEVVLFYRLAGNRRVMVELTVTGPETASTAEQMPFRGPLVPLPAGVDLDKGEQRVFDIEGLERVAIGDSEIADVKTIGKDQLLVVAQGFGKTTLLVWAKGERKSALINVRSAEHRFHKGDIEVEAGDQKPVDIEGGIRRVALGDSDIADVKTVGDKELLVIGGKPGFTTMFVWTGDGHRVQRDIRVLRSSKLDQPPADGAELYLGVGIQKVLTVRGIQRVAIGDSGICDVKTIGNDQLLLIGQGEGTTTLLIWSSDGARKSYTVHVPKAANPPTSQSLSMTAGEKFDLPKTDYRHVTADTPEIVKVVSDGNGKVHLEAQGEGRAEVITDAKDGSRVVYFIEVQTKATDAALEAARKLIKDNDYPGAKKSLATCLLANNPPLDCLMLMGTVELRLGHKQEGGTWLKKFLKLAPKDYPGRDKVDELVAMYGLY